MNQVRSCYGKIIKLNLRRNIAMHEFNAICKNYTYQRPKLYSIRYRVSNVDSNVLYGDIIEVRNILHKKKAIKFCDENHQLFRTLVKMYQDKHGHDSSPKTFSDISVEIVDTTPERIERFIMNGDKPLRLDDLYF